MRRAATLLLICVLANAAVAWAQDSASQQQHAEQKLQQARNALREVTAQRRTLENQRGDASRQLHAADQRVGSSQRTLRKTRAELARLQAQLQTLQQTRAGHAGDLQARKTALARLLRVAQRNGEQATLKTLLAHDRIATAERALIYQGYLQRAQLARVRLLAAEIARIEGLEQEVASKRAALEMAQQRQQDALAALRDARRQRAGVLAKLDRQYQSRSAREKALGRDVQALQALLARLRKAAAKAAQTQRQRHDSGKSPVTGAVAVGGLSWPVSGKLLASYGGKLPDGRRSDGVLIAAPSGTAVKAVADGTVVFADWMTGYGNILIIDHGHGYMSLYAHNDSLLRTAGSKVQRGETVASVGTSGGQTTPSLYFELRRNGEPVNPSSWLKRK